MLSWNILRVAGGCGGVCDNQGEETSGKGAAVGRILGCWSWRTLIISSVGEKDSREQRHAEEK